MFALVLFGHIVGVLILFAAFASFRRESPISRATFRCDCPSMSTLCRITWTWSILSILQRTPDVAHPASWQRTPGGSLSERRVDHFPSGASISAAAPSTSRASGLRRDSSSRHRAIAVRARRRSRASRPAPSRRSPAWPPSLVPRSTPRASARRARVALAINDSEVMVGVDAAGA